MSVFDQWYNHDTVRGSIPEYYYAKEVEGEWFLFAKTPKFIFRFYRVFKNEESVDEVLLVLEDFCPMTSSLFPLSSWILYDEDNV
jgi:hypothetical protein